MLAYKHKLVPFAHQAEAVAVSLHAPAWAYLMEQGTGKSKVGLDRAAELFSRGELRTMVVVAPNGLHRDWVVKHFEANWPDELPAAAAYFVAGGLAKERRAIEELEEIAFSTDHFILLAVNTEALTLDRTKKLIIRLLRRGPSFMLLDESDDFKTPSASRRKSAQALGNYATFRAIATGTEITKWPMDLYAQFQFLKKGCFGVENFALFKARYAEWQENTIVRGGKEQTFKTITRYRNLDELKRVVASMSYQKLLKDCVDLPPRLYQTVPVLLGASQWEQYKLIRERVKAEFPEGAVFTQNALTKNLRLAQVLGGFLPLTDEDADCPTKGNAKLDAIHHLFENIDSGSQVIVWARFKAELRLLAKELAQYGGVSEYHGDISDKDRPGQEAAFHGGENRIMLAQQQAGGRGKTWNEAQFMIYYSNDFSYRNRSQTEARNYRIGQDKTVTVIDLIAQQTIDERIREAHRSAKEIADYFKGIREFIQ